jgi:TonB family protein
MQWRFKTGSFIIPLKVAVRLPLNPWRERAQSPRRTFTAPLAEANKRALDLDATQAAQLLAHLPNGEEPNNPRATLLIYLAGKGASDPNAAQTRRDLIFWLVRVYPQDPILSSSYAIINPSDTEATSSIKQEWLNAVKQYPDDDSVIEGAANFLRLNDPITAAKIVASHHWEEQANWLGAVAATAALGVSAVSPDSGAALSSSPASINSGLRVSLLKSPDLKVVLSAMATTSQMAHDLSAHNALPADFGSFCESLLKHTRELYPQTSLDCDTTPTKPPVGQQRIGGNVMEANLIRKVQPSYPQAAKNRRIQGTVEFTATIDQQGIIENLELIRGPLALYDESYKAVMQWKYRPTMLNGVPVEIITDIIVNFTLSQ